MDEWVSIEEAAKLASVSTRTLQRWITSGKIPIRRTGRRVRVQRSALETLASPDEGAVARPPSPEFRERLPEPHAFHYIDQLNEIWRKVDGGDYVGARTDLETYLTTAAGSAAERGVEALRLLSDVCDELGDRVKAELYAADAIALAQKLGDVYGEASALLALAHCRNSRSEWAIAEEALNDAERLAGELLNSDYRSAWRIMAIALSNKAWIFRRRGEFAHAETCIERSRQLKDALSMGAGSLGYSEAYLGEISLDLGNKDAALSHFDRAARLFNAAEWKVQENYAELNRALIIGVHGFNAAACGAVEFSLRFFEQRHLPGLSIDALTVLGRLSVDQMDAERALRKAVVRAADLGDLYREAQAHFHLADRLSKGGKAEEADLEFGHAARIANSIGAYGLERPELQTAVA
jgi:excisionase family DNA binding protein